MPELSLAGVVVVAAVAFAVPLLLGLSPGLRLPSVVLEIVVGIVLGPSGLDWVHVDLPLQVLSLLGLAFLLFLAGLEIDLHQLRGKLLGLVAGGFVVSFAIGLAVSGGLGAVGLVDTPLLVAIILTATSLGVVIPVLKDADQVESDFGQLVIAAASIADFGAVILLSLFFSRDASGPAAQLLLIGGLVLLAVGVGVGLARAGRSMRLSEDLGRLQDSSAQIRVRGAVLLLAGLVLVAQRLGLETILGAFLAGALLRVVDRDEMMTHPKFRAALTANPANLRLVPLFLAVLLVVRGLPAWLYRSRVDARRSVVAGLLQATSLPFIVAATQIGMELGKLDQATGAALVAAGLLSVLLFPLAALTVLRGAGGGRAATEKVEPTAVQS
jgi:Kef-type K+ transport system membrane component KefB